MDFPILVVPGIGNSGLEHWQSRWQAAHPAWQRLEVEDWERVRCADWVAALERQITALGPQTLLVAHSLGCLAIAHWAARSDLAAQIRGALLVAVPDPQSAAFPAVDATGFTPLPQTRLPFPALIAASSDDPYGSLAHARRCAEAWGAQVCEMGAKGHLNSQSGLSDWPGGLQLLRRLADEPHATLVPGLN
ncbi:alpha/beta hydrolase [Pseudomonas sp. LS44]|uniref:RBBP9/YdeN family alpha/beta hydrolase n=1 Tax=Pseudomonas sp. LS44 TaxID=1357074 RepID=UPI00215B2E71|nr:alpha/beta hydrolase [Pseudomonas sp. LS44]UVE16327.1 alpha/beta hydrolase [Pseudomonas sp. LS44]